MAESKRLLTTKEINAIFSLFPEDSILTKRFKDDELTIKEKIISDMRDTFKYGKFLPSQLPDMKKSIVDFVQNQKYHILRAYTQLYLLIQIGD